MMTLEELLKREAPEDSEHDRAYAEEIKRVWRQWDGACLSLLEDLLASARKNYSSLKNYSSFHGLVAKCVVLYALIENIKEEAKPQQARSTDSCDKCKGADKNPFIMLLACEKAVFCPYCGRVL